MDLTSNEYNENMNDMNYELPEYDEDEGLEHDEGNMFHYISYFLFDPDLLKNMLNWAQIVKQFIFLKVGVESKRQGNKTKKETNLIEYLE